MPQSWIFRVTSREFSFADNRSAKTSVPFKQRCTGSVNSLLIECAMYREVPLMSKRAVSRSGHNCRHFVDIPGCCVPATARVRRYYVLVEIKIFLIEVEFFSTAIT